MNKLNASFCSNMLCLAGRCFHGGDHDCACEDPTEPVDRENERYWMENHDKNKQKAYEAAEMGVDVVFLGDQFVQAWDGHFMNRRIVGADVIQTKFRETFSRAGGGLVDGLALGIAGDTTANLLWRIQNGEIPDNLNPKRKFHANSRRTFSYSKADRFLYKKCGGL